MNVTKNYLHASCLASPTHLFIKKKASERETRRDSLNNSPNRILAHHRYYKKFHVESWLQCSQVECRWFNPEKPQKNSELKLKKLLYTKLLLCRPFHPNQTASKGNYTASGESSFHHHITQWKGTVRESSAWESLEWMMIRCN